MESIKKKPSDSLFCVWMLALAGGFFDAYTYVCRDGVFANAQTGNIVKLAMALAQGNLIKVVQYLIPVLAFIAGIFIALKIKNRYGKSNAPARAVLLEGLLLLVVSWIPSSPLLNIAANVLISLICAIQTETFRKFSGKPYASTMCTGNLRSMSENLYEAFLEKDHASLISAIHYFSLLAVFSSGVAVGVLCTALFGTHVIAFTSLAYLALYFYLQSFSALTLKRSLSKVYGDCA